MNIKYFLILFSMSIMACNQQAMTMHQARSQNGSLPYIENEEVEITSFDEAGYPTIQAIEALMKNQYFKKTDLVQATIIEEGMSNKRLYRVSVNGTPRLFLKLSTNKTTHQKLINLQQSQIGRLGIEKKLIEGHHLFKQNLPIITWLEKVFIYHDQDGQLQRIEVSHAAKGKLIDQIIEENDRFLIQRALLAVGKALGSFQQFFMHYNFSTDPLRWQTIAHGDFHGGNIFFDDAHSQVSFIDNENMSINSLYPIFEDMEGFYFNLGRMVYYSTTEWKKLTVLPKLILEQFQYFTLGYLETFPKDKKVILIDYLKNNINTILNEKIYQDLFGVNLDSYQQDLADGLIEKENQLPFREFILLRTHKNQLTVSLINLFEYLLIDENKTMNLLDENQAINQIIRLQKKIKDKDVIPKSAVE